MSLPSWAHSNIQTVHQILKHFYQKIMNLLKIGHSVEKLSPNNWPERLLSPNLKPQSEQKCDALQ